MAIQTDIQESKYGVPFAGAYFRIVTAAVCRQRAEAPYKYTVMLDVVGYASVPQNDDVHHVDFRRYNAPLDEVEAQAGATFLNKCYDWVMEQPDMFGSVGV